MAISGRFFLLCSSYLNTLSLLKRTYTVGNASPVTIAYPEAKELKQEHHFKDNINLAWTKLNEYYMHTDDSPVYLAATVLHPRLNWAWILRYWSDRTD